MFKSGTLPHIFKNAYAGISREMWILAITMLINRCGSMVLLFMSVYLTVELSSRQNRLLSSFDMEFGAEWSHDYYTRIYAALLFSCIFYIYGYLYG